MKRMILLSMLVFLSITAFAQIKATRPKSSASAQNKIFDPDRDASKDIKAAIAEASRTGKRILLDVGGNWCKWCHEMERYIEGHAELRALRDKNYLTVKINYSPENENKAVLSKYPKIPGYPHLFVLDKNGTLLHSQDTSLIEDGKTSYNLEKFTAFLNKWAPKKQP